MHPSSIIQSILTVLGVAITPEQCPTLKPQSYPSCKDYLQRSFDFIIVGSGPGGCALANRLTEISTWNILMVEAGGYPLEVSEIPAATLFLFKTNENWKYLSEPLNPPNAHVDNRIELTQGRVLGGSSTINGLLDIPGLPYDYNHWADLVHSDTWNWSNVKPYLAKSRQYIKRYTSAVFSNGRLKLEAAARELGIDVNGTTPFGFKDEALNVVDNLRLSMAKAYLQPIIDRKNFCLVVDTFVNKVVIDPKTRKTLGIEINDALGKTRFIKATKEVIVAAGSINSPKLLMLSGLGPKHHLQNLGIPLIKNLPVGKNLQDHYNVPLYIQLDDIDQVPFKDLLTSYCKTGEYLNNDGTVSFIGYFNSNHISNQNVSIPRDIEIITVQNFKNGVSILDSDTRLHPKYIKILRETNSKIGWLITLLAILHPKSKGTIHLKNKDPRVPPLIHLNYFDHPDDMKTMRKAIDLYLQLKNTKSLRNNQWINLEVEPCDKFKFMSKKYLECYAKMFVSTTFHFAGTCIMGRNPLNSVVDLSLRVHGVANLRVCDASIIPELISGHPSVPVAVIGEKLADIIKENYNH